MGVRVKHFSKLTHFHVFRISYMTRKVQYYSVKVCFHCLSYMCCKVHNMDNRAYCLSLLTIILLCVCTWMREHNNKNYIKDIYSRWNSVKNQLNCARVRSCPFSISRSRSPSLSLFSIEKWRIECEFLTKWSYGILITSARTFLLHISNIQCIFHFSISKFIHMRHHFLFRIQQQWKYDFNMI